MVSQSILFLIARHAYYPCLPSPSPESEEGEESVEEVEVGEEGVQGVFLSKLGQ